MDSTFPFQHGLRLLHSGMPALLPQEHQAEPRRVRAPGQGRGPHRPQARQEGPHGLPGRHHPEEGPQVHRPVRPAPGRRSKLMAQLHLLTN